ncbi:MAG TPA: methyltransferase domain-containing protein [Thermodesulfobacteriota bacterium]
MEPKLDEARARSRRVWDDMAAGWETARQDLWEVSRPVSEWLVERLDPRAGETVLDLAAGLGDTGFLAARRVGETGRVLVTDFAPRMLAAARRRAAELGIANVEFRELDAERMALESECVDGVVCRWGYMLMADPAAAFGETYRILRPGGRLAFSVFGAPERNPWASLVGGILVAEKHVPPPAPGSPGIFALSDPTRIHRLVTGAGFAPPEVAEIGIAWRFPSPDAYWWFLTEMAGALSPVLHRLAPADQATVRSRIDEAARPFRAGDGYTLPAVCVNVAARKPA